ncbi:MAG: DUF4365 domain-containing protein [Candidatus Thiodiazotropha sp.]
MTAIFPRRTDTHKLEELSVRYFRRHLPESWTCEKPEDDYGVDLRVELFEGERATGMELLIQLKASKASTDRDYESIVLKTSSYNYLWNKLQVVMLIKYIKEENKAYWLLLSDVPRPNQDHKTFTIHIPKKNDLDSIDWGKIELYLQKITENKLSKRERNVFDSV